MLVRTFPGKSGLSFLFSALGVSAQLLLTKDFCKWELNSGLSKGLFVVAKTPVFPREESVNVPGWTWNLRGGVEE